VAGAGVVVASNRGPLSFHFADGPHSASSAGGGSRLVPARGGGGLVSALGGASSHGEVVWVCAALSDADRAAAAAGFDGRLDRAGFDTAGAAVRMLDIDRVIFDRAYNAVANRTLWFLSHLLFEPAMTPSFGLAFRREWEAYETYCATFAGALDSEAGVGASVLVQDYHLGLTPLMLRKRRPDLRISYFSHTPWAPPDYFHLLPDDIGRDLLRGMLGAQRVGFLTQRWADAFLGCCRQFLGANVSGNVILHDGGETRVEVHPLGVDVEELRARGARPDVSGRLEALEEWVGGRKLILRVDRTELSKNIVRGLESYRELLRTSPQWRGRVLHLALCYPSRHDLPEYREYTAAVQRLAAEIEDEFATTSWEPLRLEVSDDWPRSLAAYALADVLLVNPVRDGMNLVAKEGPVLSRDGVALVLSREAGAAAELSDAALMINPFDVSATAAALEQALEMPADERRRRCEQLVRAAGALPPQAWFAAQLAGLADVP
jgi:trehalose 6-phosphate synthase